MARHIWGVLLVLSINGLLSHSLAQELSVFVADSSGKPVRGVEAVWWYQRFPTRLETALDGDDEPTDFLEVPRAAGVIAVHKQGYQYGGAIVDTQSVRPIKITLLKVDEVDDRRLEQQPIPIDAGLRRELLTTLQSLCISDIENAANPNEQQVATQLLAQLSPQRTLELLDAGKLQGNAAMVAKQGVVQSLAKKDVGAATAIADEESNPMFRSMLFRFLATNIAPDAPERAVIEAQWVDATRTTTESAWRLAGWAGLAEHYQFTGRAEVAKKIVEQHIDEVKKLPAGGWSGFPRSLFAAVVVEDQPDLAKQLIEGIDGNEENRALGRLAFHCCRSNPKLATELLGAMKETRVIGAPYHVKVAYRMATAHPQEAIELAQSIEKRKSRAWALGMVSHALTATDLQAARSALKLALTAAEESAQGKLRTHTSPAEIVAGLLPVAAEVAPESMHSMLWQSVFLLAPRTRWTEAAGVSFDIDCTAASLARYEPSIARELYQTQGEITDAFGQLPEEAGITLSVLDAPRLTQWLNAQDTIGRNYRSYVAVANLLKSGDDDYWDLVSQPYVMQWPSERFEDL